MRCLARGFTNREIAGELSISVRTVSNLVRSILDKLHLANRTQAALSTVQHGIALETESYARVLAAGGTTEF